MKKLVLGECVRDNIFELIDPTAFVEIDFEAEVVKALSCLQPDYHCGVFAGTFVLEGQRRKADLALIHKNLSHWFVVEVELAGHSLEDHVLRQVRCFRYGEPDDSCITSLMNAFSFMTIQWARHLLSEIPRYVAVVSNLFNAEWCTALRALDAQYLTLSIYRNYKSQYAHEIEGRLIFNTASLGFARYSALQNCLRINKGCGLPLGQIQIIDQFGSPSLWTVREEAGILWLSKNYGPTLLEHNSYVQIMRTDEGRISIRKSQTS